MTGPRPLVLVDDESLLDDILRLAAAAGCEPERISDATAARARWMGAPLVVLDDEHARECRRAGLPRRDGVVLVCASKPEKPPPEVWQRAVAVGARDVVCLPDDEPELVTAFADALEKPGSAPGSVIAVVGGRGGAGASVFVAALGLTVLRAGGSALVVDCDPAAGGLDLVLGAEAEVGLRWPELRVTAGRVSGESLRSALPKRQDGAGRLALLSCDRDEPGPTPESVVAVIEAGRRCGETVICDLARDLDAGQGVGWAVADRADLTVVIVPAEVRASVSARRLAGKLRERGVRAGMLVRGPAPGGLRVREITEAVGAPLIATMRPEIGLARNLEHGQLRPRGGGPLERAATAVLAEVPVERTKPVDAENRARAA
ncbi:MAG: hypothetical protein GEU98_11580 [Pseudonocardiaceae bacterium]|nr:hypothetical protein [Pseudonocardiaceae bacterium]